MTGKENNSYAQRLLKVLRHIEANLDQELGLEELAGVAHFSPYHFHRIFTGMVGESVKSHIRRIRLERAAHRMTFSSVSVVDAAFEAGYESHEAFTRAFKKCFGMPPNKWRERYGHGGSEGYAGRILSGIERYGGMNMDVKIVEMPVKKVAYVRHVGPYEQCCHAWGELCGWAGPKGLLGPESEFLGVCHDDPQVTAPDKIRYDACLVLTRDLEVDGNVGLGEIGGGDYAIARHQGAYSNLMKTYAYICGVWAPESGREIASQPSVEHYLNDPEKTPEDELLTDVYVPLSKT